MTRKRAKKLLMGRFRFSRRAAEVVLKLKPKNVPNAEAVGFGLWLYEKEGWLFGCPPNVVDVDLIGG